MNKDRRKRIEKCITGLTEIKDELESILMDEEDAFNNLPEGIQDSDRGQAFSDAIDYLNEAVDAIDDVITPLESID